MKAKDVADFAFQRLLILIEEGRIKPGSAEERLFLQTEIELGLHNLFQSLGHSFFPKITINWNPANPEELTIAYCPKTNRLFNELGLL